MSMAKPLKQLMTACWMSRPRLSKALMVESRRPGLRPQNIWMFTALPSLTLTSTYAEKPKLHYWSTILMEISLNILQAETKCQYWLKVKQANPGKLRWDNNKIPEHKREIYPCWLSIWTWQWGGTKLILDTSGQCWWSRCQRVKTCGCQWRARSWLQFIMEVIDPLQKFLQVLDCIPKDWCPIHLSQQQ